MADDMDRQGYSLRVKLVKPCPLPVVPSLEIKRKQYERKRTQLKSDPVKYNEHKLKDAINHRKYRKSMNNIQRENYNQKAAMRMRKYRERKKEMGMSQHIPLTRKKLIEQREYWRSKKREQRQKMSKQQKMAENMKRRQKYGAKKHISSSAKKETQHKDGNIRQAKRSLNFSEDPAVFASVIGNIITTSTPRKKKMLNENGVFVLTPKSKTKYETNAKIVARLKLNLKQLKANQTKRGKQIYYTFTQNLVGKHIVEKQMRNTLDLKWKHWCKLTLLQQEEIPKFDSMSDQTKECVKTYYAAESVTLPTKRTIMKDGTQRKVLTESLQNAYLRFRHQNPGQKVSLTSFKKYRPKDILTMNNEKFRTCLCEYCLNIEFKLEAINKICEVEKMKHLKIKNRFECIKMSLCETSKQFNNRECYERNCPGCGVDKVSTHFQELSNIDNKKVFKWKKWEPNTVKIAGKEVSRQILVEKTGGVVDLLEEFAVEMGPHANHVFIAEWQRKQYRLITQNVPKDWMISVADFAENYRCVNQDEIQSAYFNYQQATLFTMVSHYKCPSCDNNTVQESAVFITPDMKHDADAVNKFNKLMNENIKNRINFEHSVQFSDGCAAQFKSKKPFLHVSEEKQHTMERAFFGSRHGKSACDALGGLVKNQAESFVKSRRGTIPNAKALFDFCQENLAIQASGKCNHKIRTFFYVEEVDRNKEESLLQTVKGTQTFHHVRGVSEGVVKARHLACFCPVCTVGMSSDTEECENADHVGSWEIHSLYKSSKVKNQEKEKKTGNGCKQKTRKPAPRKLQSQPGNLNKRENDKVPKKKQGDSLLACSSFKELKKFVAENTDFDEIPNMLTFNWTFCNTKKIIDNNSLELVPQDIPLMPNSQLYPATIYGDGNCLPRVASVLAYGHENKHLEMRKRIVIELTKNDEQYLSNELMKRGKHPDGQENVPKAFASYSCFNMAQRLTQRVIRSIYEKEVLQVRREGEWMGLWQVASLANILKHPVVLVCPSYGTHNTRKDLHRVFYPFQDCFAEQKPLFLLWTNMNGAVPESEFVLNHFDVLMPLVDVPDQNDSLNSDDLGLIEDLMPDDEENLFRLGEMIDSPMWLSQSDTPGVQKEDTSTSDTSEVQMADTSTSDTPMVEMVDTSTSDTPEVQMADTSTSDTPMVEMVDTSTSDTPEVQMADTSTSDTPMVEMVDTSTSDTPEVQMVDSSTSDTPEAQKPYNTPVVQMADTPTSNTPEVQIVDRSTTNTPESQTVDTSPSHSLEVQMLDTSTSDTPEVQMADTSTRDSDVPEDSQLSYGPGTYLNVAHGKEVIPAVDFEEKSLGFVCTENGKVSNFLTKGLSQNYLIQEEQFLVAVLLLAMVFRRQDQLPAKT